MDEMAPSQRFTSTTQRWLDLITTGEVPSTLAEKKREIEEAEIRRKNTLESKASTLLGALGVSVTLLSVILAVIGNVSLLPVTFAIPLAVMFGLAAVHLIVAAYYAVAVAKVVDWYVDTPAAVEDRLAAETLFEARDIAEGFAVTEMNLPRMWLKSNYLSVAQSLFMRGIVLIGLGPIVAITVVWLLPIVRSTLTAVSGGS